MNKSPCKDCKPPVRYPGCQCKCQIGIAYSRKVQKRAGVIRAERNKEIQFTAFKIDRAADTKRKAGLE